MKEISDNQFQSIITSSQTPVLVDFWANWCVPCQNLTPILEALEFEFEASVSFFKMDVDKNPSTPTEYSIKSVPTLLLFKDNQVVECIVGVQPKAKLKSTLLKYI